MQLDLGFGIIGVLVVEEEEEAGTTVESRITVRIRIWIRIKISIRTSLKI